jgi:integrating conjugative element protein (TIGR03759 family)
LLSVALLIFADVTHSDTRATTVNPQLVVATEALPVDDAAAQWGLTEQEWRTYEQVMQRRRGVWSPGLDPITALGVSAATALERKRFAELYVRTEFERTRKELAFQLAVDSAWARLYPETPRIGARAAAKLTLQVASRYALIVRPDCSECAGVLQERLDTMINEAQEGVDIHVVGTGGDDNVLRGWLATQPELLAALKTGRATLNHGNQFQDLSQFPAIYSKTGNGQWMREL